MAGDPKLRKMLEEINMAAKMEKDRCIARQKEHDEALQQKIIASEVDSTVAHASLLMEVLDHLKDKTPGYLEAFCDGYDFRSTSPSLQEFYRRDKQRDIDFDLKFRDLLGEEYVK